MIYTALDSFYLTPAQLQDSPSRKDGIDEETETNLRIFGADLVQEGGILLKLPQVVMATGQVLLHRFFCKQSFARYNVKRVAASCVWLAAKLEEAPRRIRDILFVFQRINQRREGLPLEPLEQFSKAYDEQRTELIRMERHLLKEMGFICHVEHPHKFIPIYLEQLGVQDRLVQQEAWSLANDSLRTTLCVRFKSEVVACGVIYAATRRARIPLPEHPAWWLIFDATKPQIDEICRVLADLYRRPKAAYIEVGKEHATILSSRAWEPPADSKNQAVKSPTPPLVSRQGSVGKPEPSAAETGKQKVQDTICTQEAGLPGTNQESGETEAEAEAECLPGTEGPGVKQLPSPPLKEQATEGLNGVHSGIANGRRKLVTQGSSPNSAESSEEGDGAVGKHLSPAVLSRGSGGSRKSDDEQNDSGEGVRRPVKRLRSESASDSESESEDDGNMDEDVQVKKRKVLREAMKNRAGSKEKDSGVLETREVEEMGDENAKRRRRDNGYKRRSLDEEEDVDGDEYYHEKLHKGRREASDLNGYQKHSRERDWGRGRAKDTGKDREGGRNGSYGHDRQLSRESSRGRDSRSSRDGRESRDHWEREGVAPKRPPAGDLNRARNGRVDGHRGDRDYNNSRLQGRLSHRGK